MKKKLFLAGMISIALIFGMAFVGCGGDDGGSGGGGGEKKQEESCNFTTCNDNSKPCGRSGCVAVGNRNCVCPQPNPYPEPSE